MPLSCQHFHTLRSHIDFSAHTSLLKKSLSLQLCSEVQSQFFRVSSPGDAQGCMPASAVYFVLAFYTRYLRKSSDAMLLPKEITSVGYLSFKSLWNSFFLDENPILLHLCVGFIPFSLLALIFQMEAAALTTNFPFCFFPPFFLSSLHCLYLLTATPILIYQNDLFTFIGPCRIHFPCKLCKRSC